MIEMIFVIVILGILSAIAIPRLAATRDDAILTKGQAQVASIRSGIVLQKSKNMFSGTLQSPCNSYYPCKLSPDTNATLFYFADGNSSNILEYPIYPEATKDGGWTISPIDPNKYSFQFMGLPNVFDYNATTGSFNCTSGAECSSLTR